METRITRYELGTEMRVWGSETRSTALSEPKISLILPPVKDQAISMSCTFYKVQSGRLLENSFSSERSDAAKLALTCPNRNFTLNAPWQPGVEVMSNRLADSGKANYESPVLTRIGSFEDITQGLAAGNKTDQLFPNDTPKSKLTFS